MERLINEEGLLICSKESVCRDDDECYCDTAIKAFKKLKQYEDLEEQGMLLRLPVAVGSEVHVADKNWNRVFSISVISVSKDNVNTWVRCGNGIMYLFGTEVFATKEAAEAALEEMEK